MNGGNLWQGRYPLFVTAHRGGSGGAPENTLAAFRAAIALGCDMIELDVHLAKHGEVVVIHDDTLERTTDGRGRVAEHPFSVLKRLDAGAWFGPSFAGERIPCLTEVLTLARGKILVNIELKKEKAPRYPMAELADRAREEVAKAGMGDQVLFSSFDPAALDRIRESDPALPVALITAEAWQSPEEAGKGKIYPTINCRYAVLTESALRRAHASSVRVHAWTVNDPRSMKRLMAMGIDGIITNHPERLLRLLHP